MRFHPLAWLRARLEDELEYGEPLWPRARHGARWLFRRHRRAARRTFFRLLQRLLQRWLQRWRPQRIVGEQVLLQNALHAAHGVGNFREIHVPAVVVIDPASAFAPVLRRDFPPQTPLLSRRGFVCRVAHPHFHPGEGLLVTRGGALLADSAFAPYRLDFSEVYGAPVPRLAPFLEGRYSAIWGLFDSNIYHWLIDALPRLHSLEIAAAAPLTLLMPDLASRYHLESLQLCLPDSMEIRIVKSTGWVEVQEFVFASYLTQAGCVSLPKSHSDALRRRVLERLGLSAAPVAGKRIYISRRKAASRHVLNEAEVIESLRALGFAAYHLEDWSFAEQVRLFHDAEIVVAPHGAGLANILFAPHIKVLELQTTRSALHYFFLAQSLGRPYKSVLSPPRHSANFVVSVAELEKALAPWL